MKPPNRLYRRLRKAPKPLRIAIGLVLVVAGGLGGFLPILGFWMLPLGLAIIFIDSLAVKRTSSRLRTWWCEKVVRRYRQARS